MIMLKVIDIDFSDRHFRFVNANFVESYANINNLLKLNKKKWEVDFY